MSCHPSRRPQSLHHSSHPLLFVTDQKALGFAMFTPIPAERIKVVQKRQVFINQVTWFQSCGTAGSGGKMDSQQAAPHQATADAQNHSDNLRTGRPAAVPRGSRKGTRNPHLVTRHHLHSAAGRAEPPFPHLIPTIQETTPSLGAALTGQEKGHLLGICTKDS